MLGLAIFLILGVLLVYIVALYPIGIAWIARRRTAPLGDSVERTVSIIVPVHNGAPFLAAKLESILALDYPKECMEILVVDDGSTDETAAIADRFSSRVRVFSQEKSGK